MAKTRFWDTSDEPQTTAAPGAEQEPLNAPTVKPEPTGLRAALLRARKNPRSSGKSASVSMPPPDPLLDANPASRPAFLARLATFTRPGASYGSGALPDVLDAAHAAAAGWHCPASLSSLSTSSATDSSRSGTPTRPRSRLSTSSMSSLRDSAASTTSTPNRLECATCKKTWVVSGNRGMTRDAAMVLAKKQAALLVDQHAELCPWRAAQCDRECLNPFISWVNSNPHLMQCPLYTALRSKRRFRPHRRRWRPQSRLAHQSKTASSSRTQWSVLYLHLL